MKKLLIPLLLISSAVCFAGVNTLVEFAAFAADWQAGEDLDSFRDDFIPDWLNYDPNATDSSDGVATYTLTEVDMDGMNCNQWTISSLPANGILYDIYGTAHRPLSAAVRGNNYCSVRAVPYRVKRGSSALWYLTESTAGDSFGFTVKNTDDGRTSDAATVTITKSSYVKDSLCFDRDGSVSIPDNAAIDFDDSFTFFGYIKPQERFGSILKKRGSTGAGIEISIRAAYLVIEAWNTSGEYGKVILGEVWMDTWQFISITAGHATAAENTPGLPDPPYSNDEPVVIGSRSVAQIDKLTWYPAKSADERRFFSERQEYNGFMEPMDYTAQFRCDEGAGSTITDFVSGTLTGTLTSVTWQPNDRPRRNKYNLN